VALLTKAQKSQWKADDVVVCWNSFSDTQIPFTAKTGLRLKGDHSAVQKHPECFVREFEPLPDPSNAAPPTAEPIGKVKLRVKTGQGGRDTDLVGGGSEQTVNHGGEFYVSGQTFTAEGADARYLLDTGVCEIVESPLKGLN
jgi:hypothetical protein